MTVPLYREEIRGDVVVIDRTSFATQYLDYRPGEHVVFGGPTTRGKTTLAFDLLRYICTPRFPAYVAVSKPRDPVTETRGKALRYHRVDQWPPPPRLAEMLGADPPSGYLIWPRFGNLATDMNKAAEVTSKLLMERYAKGASRRNAGGVLVMDDTMVKAKVMGLDSEMVTILAMAGAMKLSIWVFVQKPTDSGRTPLWAYEQATHLFLTQGGDDRMMRRYREIIGEHGRIATEAIRHLKPFEFLYVHKVHGHMCVVGAE